jgi:anti-anti-sigma regulatory factor
MPDHPLYELVQQNDVTRVQFVPSKLFGHALISELRDSLNQLIESEKPGKLLIDFGRIEYCSTELINVLLGVKKLLVASGGQLKLCGMRDDVREVYRMLNVDGNVFNIYGTESDAIADF